MNEVKLKYELIKLEKKNFDINGEPIEYKQIAHPGLVPGRGSS